MIVVLPTRNRAELAIRAARSAAGVRLLVSDNSTDEGERARLAGFCRAAGVELCRPPRDMAMGEHWEWACAQATERAPDEHLGVMTDRSVWKRGAVARLARAVAAEPDRIVSFLHDAIWDNARPIRVQLSEWSGELAEIEARAFLELIVRGRRHQSIPRLLNCAVPPRVVRAIRARFGTLCTGHAPDYAFGFRALAVEPVVVHLAEALQVSLGMDRSNGVAHALGVWNKDAQEFRRSIQATGEAGWASPVAGLISATNVIASEYNVVRRMAPELPEVRLPDLLDALAREARSVPVAEVRDEALARIEAAGWRPDPPRRRTIFARVRRTPQFRQPVDRARRAVAWAVGRLRAGTGVALLDARQFVFDDVGDALRAVDEWPRRPGPAGHPPALRSRPL